MRVRPDKVYKESMKQKVGYLGRLILSQHEQTEEEEDTNICIFRNEKGDITTNTNKIQRIIREYFENLYSSKMENLDEMDKFLAACDQTILNQEDIKH
jgi:hypothetical protein